MNKSHLAIIALSISAHSISWGMLTVSKIQPCVAKKYFTQEKIEKRGLIRSKNFLDSFGEGTLDETGALFCSLPRTGQERVLRHLNDDQTLVLRIGIHKGLDFYVLSELFNGNRNVARIYVQKPIREILEAYVDTRQAMRYFPIKISDNRYLDIQHCIMLQNRHKNTLSRIQKEKKFVMDDIEEMVSILQMLKDVDPEIGDDIEILKNSIKLYPSMFTRVLLYCKTLAPIFTNAEVLLSGGFAAGFGALSKCGVLSLPTALMALLSGFRLCNHLSFQLNIKELVYYNHLHNNILPNQPTLTDYLKKTAL